MWERFAAVVAVAAVLAVGAPGAAMAGEYAAAVPSESGKAVVSWIKGDDANRRSYRATREVSDVASSDRRVVSARAHADGHGFDLLVRRAGRAKVSFKVGGARRTIAFKVVRYANPVKSFVVGGRDVAKRFKKARYFRFASKKGDLGKLRVVPARGWRLRRMYTGFSESGSLRLRNGEGAGGALNVRAVLVNKASGVVETVEVRNG